MSNPDRDSNVLASLEGLRPMMNASVVQVLRELKAREKKVNPGAVFPDCFEKALLYATRFAGVIGSPEQALGDAVNSLENALERAELTLRTEDGTEVRETLHAMECVALANLNPGSVEAARELIPTLVRFTEDSVEDVLSIIRREGLKMGGFGGAVGGGAGGRGGDNGEGGSEE
jgi:hypothetical protein